jgi:ribosomal protein S18 acetylase RimI-like enzyme
MPKVKYFKRYRMELALGQGNAARVAPADPRPDADLPAGFGWLAWDDARIGLHADVKYRSFHQHEDALVFPSLSSRAGCHDLMAAIRFRPNFCAEATWLVAGPDGAVGTIQGLLDDNGYGGIQNLGVVPECRGLGLGRALLLKALAGFASVGVPRAFLEVTASNEPAVRMYRSVGFRAYKTLYRGVELLQLDTAYVGL